MKTTRIIVSYPYDLPDGKSVIVGVYENMVSGGFLGLVRYGGLVRDYQVFGDEDEAITWAQNTSVALVLELDPHSKLAANLREIRIRNSEE